jgi:hypothetical protein
MLDWICPFLAEYGYYGWMGEAHAKSTFIAYQTKLQWKRSKKNGRCSSA